MIHNRYFLFFIILLCFSQGVQGQFANRIITTSTNETRAFGHVAVSSTAQSLRMLVGANDDATYGVSGGAAYVYHYEQGNWQEKGQFYIPLGSSNHFASAVGISQDWILISEHFHSIDNIRQGSVHGYYYNGIDWIYQGKINPSDLDRDDLYGTAIDVREDLAILAAMNGNNASGSSTGVVYIYRLENNTWVQQDKLVPVLDEEQFFGSAVATDGSHLLISSQTVIGGIPFWDAVYFYHYDGTTWNQVHLGYLEDQNSSFGIALDVSGNWAAIGNSLKNGSVHMYRFQNGTWEEHSILKAPDDSVRYNGFGQSVSLDNGRILVGSPSWSVYQGESGGNVFEYAYDVAEDAWRYEGNIRPHNADSVRDFGHWVQLEDGMRFIGAPGELLAHGGQGAVYVYGEPPVGISVEEVDLPVSEFTIDVYPNPLVTEGTLQLSTKTAGPARVVLFDMLGRERQILFDGMVQRDDKLRIPFSGAGLASGAYLIQVLAGEASQQTFIIKQ